MSAEDESLLELDGVCVHYEDEPLWEEAVPQRLMDYLGIESSPPVRAVDNVDLTLGEQDVVALVGESGCGKTTLGKTAVALQKPTDGHIRYRGHDIWELKEGGGTGEMLFEDVRRQLQIIHQDPGAALNPYRTIKSSLSEPLKRWYPELSYSDRRERIVQFLERTGLHPGEDFAHRYPHQLSGGEQQRVALVRAMLMEPDIILADEAVGALDVSLRVEIMDLMLELQEEFDTSYIFVSHNLSNARYLAGHADGKIAVMYLGEIVEIGPPDELITNPQHPYTKILAWATPELDPDKSRGSMHDRPPLREIDIPDPVNPPSGCRFHTRCPVSRTACTEEKPDLFDAGINHNASCFRILEDHPYWSSDPLPGGHEDVELPEI